MTVTAPNTSTTIASHAYRWKLTEIIALTVTAAGGLWWAVTAAPAVLGWVVFAVAVAYTYVNANRKRVSAIAIISDGTHWHLTRRGVAQQGRGATLRLSDLAHVDYQDRGAYPTLVLATHDNPDSITGPDVLAVPERLAATREFQAALRPLIDDRCPHITGRARTWLDDLTA